MSIYLNTKLNSLGDQVTFLHVEKIMCKTKEVLRCLYASTSPPPQLTPSGHLTCISYLRFHA
jgi:hypothetical protein